MSQLGHNAIWSGVQTLVATVALFWVYRYLLDVLSAESIGVWSTVVATVSFGRLADLGINTATSRYLAEDVARKDWESASRTFLLSLGIAVVFVALAVALIYMLFAGVMTGILGKGAGLQQAVELFPAAVAAMWMSVVSAIILALLDGAQRADLRAQISSGGTVCHVVAAYALVPHLGLPGIAWSQFAQHVMTCTVGLFVAKRVLPGIRFRYLPRRSDFTRILGYSLRFQAISVAQIVLESSTKFLVVKFGGTSFAGFFEMAYRLIMQLRGIIASMLQVLIPYAAYTHVADREAVDKVTEKSTNMVATIALPLFAGVCLFAPLVSFAWLGRVEGNFVISVQLLAISWGFTLIAAPSFYVMTGVGALGTIFWATAANVVVLGAAGLVLGALLGASGVLIAAAVGHGVGAGMVLQQAARFVPSIRRLFLTFDRNAVLLVVASLVAGVAVAIGMLWSVLPALKLAVGLVITCLLLTVAALRSPGVALIKSNLRQRFGSKPST